MAGSNGVRHSHSPFAESRDRAIDDELHRERGENDAEQSREDAGDAQETRKTFRQQEHQGAAQEHGADQRDENRKAGADPSPLARRAISPP
jgi:hypothetical protein